MKKALLFVGFSIVSCLICLGFLCILYVPFDSKLQVGLLYLLTLGYCYIFFKYRPVICNIFVLAASFVLLSASICAILLFTALNTPYDPSDMMGNTMLGWIAIFAMLMYTGPFFVLSVIIAVIEQKKVKKTD